jgi:hypothetical protein
MNQIKNPFVYVGPLDPIENKVVCIPRKDEIEEIVRNCSQGRWTAIYSPFQTGKTTLLHLIRKKFDDKSIFYFNFTGKAFDKEEELATLIYTEIENTLGEKCEKLIPQAEANKNRFSKIDDIDKFLWNLAENSKSDSTIPSIILIDEIGSAKPNDTILDFLRLLRRFYHKSVAEFGKQVIKLVFTGSFDIFKFTLERWTDSPFNVATTLFLRDFTESETEELIKNGFKALNIEVSSDVIEFIFGKIQGQPALTQQVCYRIAEVKLQSGSKCVEKKDVKEVLPKLMAEDKFHLSALSQKIETEREKFQEFIKRILEGKKEEYWISKEYIFSAYIAGLIRNENGFCKIRNPIYEDLLRDILKVPKLIPVLKTFRNGDHLISTNILIAGTSKDMQRRLLLKLISKCNGKATILLFTGNLSYYLNEPNSNYSGMTAALINEVLTKETDEKLLASKIYKENKVNIYEMGGELTAATPEDLLYLLQTLLEKKSSDTPVIFAVDDLIFNARGWGSLIQISEISRRGNFRQKLWLVTSSPHLLPVELNIESYFLFLMLEVEDINFISKKVSQVDKEQLGYLNSNECLCFGSLWKKTKPILTKV